MRPTRLISKLTLVAIATVCIYLVSVITGRHNDVTAAEDAARIRSRIPVRVDKWRLASDILEPRFSPEVSTRKNNKLCPIESVKSGLAFVNESAPTWSELKARHPELNLGGRWRPEHCQWRHRVAIIIPYRNREEQLRLFLQHMHPFLQSQNLDYGIYVAEQAGNGDFNRGLARNVGFLEATKLDNPDCSVFHDVDLLPLDHRNFYGCPDIPRHLCVAVDYIQNFRPLYKGGRSMFGGAVSLRNKHFLEVNGYSNLYFGWGAEDADLYRRLVANGYEPYRYPDIIGRYQGLKHPTEKFTMLNGDRRRKYQLLRVSDERWTREGLNSMKYNILNIERGPLYTWITFEVTKELKYRRETLRALRQYYDLYGDLTPFWGRLPFTAGPRWWQNDSVPEEYQKFRPKIKKSATGLLGKHDNASRIARTLL